VLAAEGWSKDDVRQYLFDNAKVPAREVLKRSEYLGLQLEQAIADGRLGSYYHESDDPDRLIPVFLAPEWTGLVVAGNPDMYWQQGFVSNHAFGAPVTKVIELPADWAAKLDAERARLATTIERS
jgi:hypothetical protein